MRVEKRKWKAAIMKNLKGKADGPIGSGMEKYGVNVNTKMA